MISDNFWLADTDISSEEPDGLAKLTKKPPIAKPIIIDFGSWQCRAGFGGEEMPSLVFDQQVHRVCDRDGVVHFAFGRSVPAGVSKSASRSPFENGLIVHHLSVERIFDHIFDACKFTTTIDRPIIITEPIGNPIYIKKELAEMLFEGYNVEKLAFVDDILPSLFLNHPKCTDSLVLNFGHSSTNVVLVKNKQIHSSKRLNFGGSQACDLLMRVLQCKYPNFPIKVSPLQVQCLLRKACQFVLDYEMVISELETVEGIQKHDFVVQFPYPVIDKAFLEEKQRQEEALTARRREMAHKLRERAEAKKMEKLKSKEDRVKALESLVEKVAKSVGKKGENLKVESGSDSDEDEVDDETFEEMKLHGFETVSELHDEFQEATRDLDLYKNKLEGIVEDKGEPNYDLINVPDNLLTSDQVKEKRRQRLIKSSADAREKVRLEKEEEMKKARDLELKEEEWRHNDLAGWRAHYYSERNQLMKRINSRQKQRDALTDRRSQATGTRLRNVMSLVDNPDQPAKRKKAKKGELDAMEVEINEEDDGFGQNDSDWQIYRQIRRNELEDEYDEQDQARLSSIESKLEQFDPNFFEVLAEEMSQKATLLDYLRTGGIAKIQDEDADKFAYQLHLNVERFRIPEVYFEPHIAGIDQAGLSEIVSHVIGQDFSVLKNVFLTGGMSKLPGLEERLAKELTELAPVGTPITISKSASLLDPWKGLSSGVVDVRWIAKEDYDLNGAESLSK